MVNIIRLAFASSIFFEDEIVDQTPTSALRCSRPTPVLVVLVETCVSLKKPVSVEAAAVYAGIRVLASGRSIDAEPCLAWFPGVYELIQCHSFARRVICL